MYETLFTPIQIGNVEVKNRFVLSPLGTRYPDDNHYVTQRLIDHYGTRAKGGFGLLIVEFTAITADGRTQAKQLGIWDDSYIQGHKKLVERVHQDGGKIFLQLTHAGRQVKGGFANPGEIVSASPVQCPSSGIIPRELTNAEVYQLIEDFASAAKRAQEAGYDAVEIHGANGYLVGQFLSAFSNKRTDEFGGSVKGRAKFLCDIIKRVHEVCGADYTVSVRINTDDHVQDGIHPQEAAMIATFAEEAGAAAINTSVSVYASGEWLALPGSFPMGYNSYGSEEIKKAVSIPVLLSGRINEPWVADFMIKSNKADMVALGRAGLAEPEFPNKIKLGKIDEICPCISCNQGCQAGAVDPAYGYVSCVINPFVGFEGTLIPKEAAVKKKVAVVGAGSAGMLAAWTAAKCGHSVILFEKDTTVGGQLKMASTPPGKQDITKVVRYYETMCKKYGVEIRLQTEASPALIKEEQFDAVILATGGTPLMPNIKGIKNPTFHSYTDVLKGKVDITGKNVLIAGGGMVAAETAEFIAEHHCAVTMVEAQSLIAGTVPGGVRKHLLGRLQDLSVSMYTDAPIREFLEDGVLCEKDGAELRLDGFECIVLAMGSRSFNPLEEEMRTVVDEVYVIGDAEKAGNIRNGTDNAIRIALAL